MTGRPDHPESTDGTDTAASTAEIASPAGDLTPAAPPRRHVLRGLAIGAGSAGLGAVAATAWAGRSGPETHLREDVRAPVPVSPHGDHQAGIDRPATPPQHGCVTVLDLDRHGAPQVRSMLAAVGEEITRLTTTGTPELPDGPGDVTVTVGIGPAVVRSLRGPDVPGAQALPRFDSDADLDEQLSGGDLFLAVYGSDPNATADAMAAVTSAVGGGEVRWGQRCFRGPGQGTIVRNPLGFHDGVIVPRSTEELAENVWIPDGPAAGGTVLVVRRIVLDAEAFRSEPVARQEQIVGRRRSDGAPLSGGGLTDEVDLLAKTADGEFRTPARSHVRAAHPSFTGSQLMLRRGYAFDNGGADSGLLFMCFQRDLRTFVRTQQRLDDSDDLMDYTRVSASGAFLVLPGFTSDRPLGSTL
ncbi:Dyp-type peroxidase [Ruania alba]|uniref:Dye decolorizing peroxidase n=1 Tax=Ruania alba TaxID=648782 RepID=A0A1H5M3E9_9MICO|nr:Dyp-type peroxidase [Ruania alba]SEE83909.1 dye decolorizing peroxidase [Ruania alba]